MVSSSGEGGGGGEAGGRLGGAGGGGGGPPSPRSTASISSIKLGPKSNGWKNVIYIRKVEKIIYIKPHKLATNQ